MDLFQLIFFFSLLCSLHFHCINNCRKSNDLVFNFKLSAVLCIHRTFWTLLLLELRQLLTLYFNEIDTHICQWQRSKSFPDDPKNFNALINISVDNLISFRPKMVLWAFCWSGSRLGPSAAWNAVNISFSKWDSIISSPRKMFSVAKRTRWSPHSAPNNIRVSFVRIDRKLCTIAMISQDILPPKKFSRNHSTNAWADFLTQFIRQGHYTRSFAGENCLSESSRAQNLSIPDGNWQRTSFVRRNFLLRLALFDHPLFKLHSKHCF